MASAPRIRLLPPLVAERIAAGEVIERPASVVKELVENSLDAGATEVAVILEQGGKLLIEVIDNGHGIHPGDIALSTERHATSKLRELEDLQKLRTLGFRGEALPSIAAVSEMSILSRAKGSDAAYELRAGEKAPRAITFGHFLGSEHGTRMRAAGLFSQIPARLKFLKSQGAEVSQVRDWIERLALTHPEVGFRLVSDDRTVLDLRPCNEEQRVRAVLSDGDDYPIVSAETAETDRLKWGCRVKAYWLQGLSSPQTRKIVQIVNGRALRDRLIQQALLVPFRQALLPGQFPAVAVFIEIDPDLIDVNVHPTKTEVRFLDSRKIFHAVESAVTELIVREGAQAYAAAPARGFELAAQPVAPAEEPRGPSWNFAPTSAPQWRASEPSESLVPDTAPRAARPEPLELAQETQAHPFRAHPFAAGRYVGIIFNTYLVYDFGEELKLIDQHAAHERVRYERLRKRALNGDASGASQALLMPESVKFPAEQRLTLEERLPLLERIGFEVELFGDDAALFRAVPAEWGTDSLRTRLRSLVERVIAIASDERLLSQETRAQNLLLDEALFESLASEACHSAIRAGDRLSDTVAEELVDQLFECEHPWNCPHGRPTVARIPRARFEEWFQRKV